MRTRTRPGREKRLAADEFEPGFPFWPRGAPTVYIHPPLLELLERELLERELLERELLERELERELERDCHFDARMSPMRTGRGVAANDQPCADNAPWRKVNAKTGMPPIVPARHRKVDRLAPFRLIGTPSSEVPEPAPVPAGRCADGMAGGLTVALGRLARLHALDRRLLPSRKDT